MEILHEKTLLEMTVVKVEDISDANGHRWKVTLDTGNTAWKTGKNIDKAKAALIFDEKPVDLVFGVKVAVVVSPLERTLDEFGGFTKCATCGDSMPLKANAPDGVPVCKICAKVVELLEQRALTRGKVKEEQAKVEDEPLAKDNAFDRAMANADQKPPLLKTGKKKTRGKKMSDDQHRKETRENAKKSRKKAAMAAEKKKEQK